MRRAWYPYRAQSSKTLQHLSSRRSLLVAWDLSLVRRCSLGVSRPGYSALLWASCESERQCLSGPTAIRAMGARIWRRERRACPNTACRVGEMVRRRSGVGAPFEWPADFWLGIAARSLGL